MRDMDEPQWVLVGTWNGRTKVIGPYPTADDAREGCNELGILEATWAVLPLTRAL